MILTPAGTPEAVVRKLNESVNAVMQEERILQRFGDMAMEPRSDTTPQTAAQWLKVEMDKWEPLVRAAGTTPN